MDIRFRSKFVVPLLFLISGAVYAKATHKVIRHQVKVGETMELKTAATSGFHLSRKGIVSLHRVSDTLWQIIGLQRGIVVLSPFANPDQSILIKSFREEKKHVKPNSKKRSLNQKSYRNILLKIYAKTRNDLADKKLGGLELIMTKKLVPNNDRRWNKTVFESHIRSVMGKKFELSSRGDFGSTYSRRGRHQDSFHIEGTMTQTRKDILFTYSLEVFSKTASDQPAMSKKIESTQIISPGEEFSLGSIYLDRYSDQLKEIYPLNQIPILSPLTRLIREQSRGGSIELVGTLKLEKR